MSEVTESRARPAAATSDLAQLGSLSAKKPRSLWSDAFRQFRRHRLAMAGFLVLIFLVLAAIVGPMIYGRDPFAIDNPYYAPPSASYPMGTDDMGHDIFARILWGGRISLSVGVAAMLVAITVGTLIGAMAGFFGSFVDSLLMRVTDLFISLPQLPLLLVVIYLFQTPMKKSFGILMGTFILVVVVIGLLTWMPVARLVRASFLSTKEKEFIEAARSIGAGTTSLIFKHILPNVLSPVIVAATLGVAQAIITESSLSFLGLGFEPTTPTWGRLLFDAQAFISITPWAVIFPGLAIFFAVLSINYVGDGLRDALDPRRMH